MLRFWSFRTIPDKTPCMVSNNNEGSATIVAMPRHDTILDAISHDRCSYWRSLFSIDWLRTQKQLMEGASSYQPLKALGEGRVEITFISKPTPPSEHLVHLLLIQVLGMSLASKLLCWLDADKGEREQFSWEEKVVAPLIATPNVDKAIEDK